MYEEDKTNALATWEERDYHYFVAQRGCLCTLTAAAIAPYKTTPIILKDILKSKSKS